jgi:uncharacterized protein (TIGR02145 family)
MKFTTENINLNKFTTESFNPNVYTCEEDSPNKFSAESFSPSIYTCEENSPNKYTCEAYPGYEEVKIGTQVWMLKNWHVGGWVPSEAHRSIYGSFYSHAQAKILYIPGYHLPTNIDWNVLLNFFGGQAIAGEHLKEAGLDHWATPNFADNSSGFTALGSGNANNNIRFNFNMGTRFWSADELIPSWPYYIRLNNNLVTANLLFINAGLNQFCVRLIKN